MSFDPATVALHGRHLIEASAGTGKTYSIANLFLRLLLEPHPSQTNNKPLRVEQILVVTFTNAATDELRGRIRKKIEEALQHFRGGASSDAFIRQYKQMQLSEESTCRAACDRLYDALMLVDDAAIFTIHSFAARAIQTFLFETGALADVEVNIGGSTQEQQQLDDIARLLAVGKHAVLGKYLESRNIDSRKYAEQLSRLLKRSNISLLANSSNIDGITSIYEKERKKYLKERKQLSKQWVFFDTKAKDYNSQRDAIAQEIGGEASNRNITDCINFCNNKFSGIDGFYKLGKTQQVILDSPYVDQLSGTAKQLYAMMRNLADFNVNEERFVGAIAVGQSELLSLLEQKKTSVDLAQMQPDDIIQLINSKLNEPLSAKILRAALTQQFPLCMVDEFQDTDPDQFRVFDRLYQDTKQLGLFAIGDPKQSIYAFRGADIFSYLDVKSNIEPNNIHSLDINFRSKQGVMDGVNALFNDDETQKCHQPVFVYEGIEYESVYSCENPPQDRDMAAQALGVFRTGKQAHSSIVFIGNTATESQTFNSLIPLYAADCAERTLALLQGEKRATVEKNGVQEPIKAGDIAILVKDFAQANAIKTAMANKGLAAVYLAQKDSVFKRCLFAQDLLFILRAMDEPRSLHHLKAAFATPLMRQFQTGTALLDSLDTDDGFEKAIEQFGELCKHWEARGVFSALHLLFDKFNLHLAFAAQIDCDRLMTDFRHLGDLLQQQYLLTGSRERLLDWYASQLFNDSELDEEAKSLRLESDDNLIKIVTLHGCKGLEYPIVFIPFFFGFRETDLLESTPFYHQKSKNNTWEAVLDFQSESDAILQAMRLERMAEDMRLLYVGVTRAIYQCYIGISQSHHGKVGNQLLQKSCWAHLLNLTEDEPSTWNVIQRKLQQRMGSTSCAYETLLPASHARYQQPQTGSADTLTVAAAVFPVSSWKITSYSALAHQKDLRLSAVSKQDEPSEETLSDEEAFVSDSDDAHWKNDIRYSLWGGINTGDCLHKVFERLANGEALNEVLAQELRTHGLADPEGKVADSAELEALKYQRQQSIDAWLQAVLSNPLHDTIPSLQELFSSAYVLPECAFDFSLGSNNNSTIKNNPSNGIMTGSIDLLFIHNKKVYVLDYKSNTLGKAPRFYSHDNMHQAMIENRYDLQYSIYSVAAHRYMQQRLGDRYAFDDGEYSFGGVLYLFLRGMGLADYPQQGIYFTRPSQQQITTLDADFYSNEVRYV